MIEKQKILTDILGSYKRFTNGEMYFHCPFCEHHKKKLAIRLSHGFHCWVCDARGKNIYRIIRKFGSYSHRQKWLELDGKLNLSDFDTLFEELVEEKQKVDLPEDFISLCNRRLPLSSQRPLEYLLSRGLTKRDIFRWKAGFSKQGRYGGRIIIPSFDNRGDVNYFIARSYVGHKKRYLNPPCGRDIVFNELFIDWDEPVVLVEGVFDAIVAGDNAIPILGSTLREKSKLFQALVRHDTPVFLGLDPDADKKTRQMIKSMLQYDLELYTIPIDEHLDVGDMTRGEFKERKNNATLVDHDELFLLDELRRIV